MKLAKGSNRKIESFLNHSHRQLQTTSLSSKLSIANDIVNECVYICNQNFDHRNDFHCVAMSDDDWMLWNFDNKTIDLNVISNHIPQFLDVYHVRVTRLHDQFFLKCDCLLYHRYVSVYMNEYSIEYLNLHFYLYCHYSVVDIRAHMFFV
jgi:hypothetical protein